MIHQVFTGLPRVARDGLPQGVESIVLLLVAQLLQEAHTQVLAVQVALPVEEMYLQERQRHRINGGTPADARHTRTKTVYLHHENAGDRRRPTQDDVGGREAEAAAEPRAARPTAAGRLRTHQAGLGGAEL